MAINLCREKREHSKDRARWRVATCPTIPTSRQWTNGRLRRRRLRLPRRHLPSSSSSAVSALSSSSSSSSSRKQQQCFTILVPSSSICAVSRTWPPLPEQTPPSLPPPSPPPPPLPPPPPSILLVIWRRFLLCRQFRFIFCSFWARSWTDPEPIPEGSWYIPTSLPDLLHLISDPAEIEINSNGAWTRWLLGSWGILQIL